jgi:RNA polymerase sigma-70 factor (ECF subfamily)
VTAGLLDSSTVKPPVRWLAMEDPMAEDRAARVMEIYDREALILYRLAYRITGSREDARDAVQETFARLVQHKDLDSLVKPESWLRTVITRLSIDLRRRRNADVDRKRERALELMALDESTSGNTGDAVLERKEKVAALRRGIEQLAALDRALLLRRSLDDVPLAELADAYGVTEKAVRNRLSRARIFLRQRMKREEG